MSKEIEPGMLDKELSRRDFLRLGAGVAASALAAGPLSQLVTGSAFAASSPFASAQSIPLKTLIAGAKKEDGLNTIALPLDWANYGAIIAAFEKKYGIKINNIAPNDSSGQELQAVTQYKSNRSLEPDAVDVGPSFAAEGKTEGLWSPYKVATWDTIPATLKDPNGYWTGDYYGVEAFGTNTKVVKNPPKTWSDLLKPEYKNQVGIDNDPRSSQDAFSAVFAAALGNGGSLDNIEPGIEFFAQLKKIGNFVPVQTTAENIASGVTPIAIMWDYLLLGYKAASSATSGLEVALPTKGILGGFYAQAVSKYAYHPYTARLWEEFLYSDEGQLLWLAGGAHPVRYNDLAAAGKIPSSLASKLPPAAGYKKAQFPSVAQQNKAAKVVAAQWASKVLSA
jgi:putative spermidine/putrescine transport system substrate-binding protein